MFSSAKLFTGPATIGIVLIIAGLVVGLVGGGVALAYSTGISGHSGNPGTNGGMTCNACHGGGQAPVVTLSGPTSVVLGSTHAYVLTVQSTNPDAQAHAGLNVSATGGTLAVGGADTQVMEGEITHSQPKANTANGVASFTFQWTAPLQAGTVTLYGAGNSVELNGYPGGDYPALDNLTIAAAVAATATPESFTAAATTRPSAAAVPSPPRNPCHPMV